MRPPAIQAERPGGGWVEGRREQPSMRPPAIQAERRGSGLQREGKLCAFNEAACNTGGTPTGPASNVRTSAFFNEAACNTGGTPPYWDGETEPVAVSSMRPPAIQAERLQPAEEGDGRRSPSMRPPAIQAERLNSISKQAQTDKRLQ